MESQGKKRLIRISVWVAVLSMLLAVVSSLATALEASAHAALRSMTPAAGSTVTTAPSQITLTFSEPISASFATVTVTDAQGGSVASGRAAVRGQTVTQGLERVGSGRYTVAFRVVSQDGHPVSQRATFTVALPDTTTPAAESSPSPPAPTADPGAAAAPVAGDDGPTASLPWVLGVVAFAAAAGALVWRRHGRSGE